MYTVYPSLHVGKERVFISKHRELKTLNFESYNIICLFKPYRHRFIFLQVSRQNIRLRLTIKFFREFKFCLEFVVLQNVEFEMMIFIKLNLEEIRRVRPRVILFKSERCSDIILMVQFCNFRMQFPRLGQNIFTNKTFQYVRRIVFWWTVASITTVLRLKILRKISLFN